MKNLCKLIIVACLYACPGIEIMAQNLGNQEVVKLVESGLPSSVIVSKINSSQTNFDLSTDALIKLSENKVPEDVINAMMAKGGASSEYTENSIYNNFPRGGIYAVVEEDSGLEFDYMEATVISKTKEGGFGSHMARSLSVLGKNKVRASVLGESANLVINNNSPEFYFYFDDKKPEEQPVETNQNDPLAMIRSLQQMSGGATTEFQSIGSPNQIVLVKADVKKKERMFVAAESSGVGSDSGIDADYIINFRYEEEAPGLYRVYFNQPLEPGEYLFTYAGISMHQGQEVFDFSIR